ncbi:MAG TPA: zf-HC2 domain-containing protein [Longimicrobium sp.]|jgi:anti-sigma factor RsiW
MTHAPPAFEHLDDGAIVRFLDGEAAADERAGVEAHLAACPVCTERMAALRRRSVNLGILLARGDFAVPALPAPAAAPVVDELAARRAARRMPARPWLQAAAVAMLLVSAGLFAAPVRGWVRGLLGTGSEQTAVRPAPAPPAPAPEAALAGARIQFTPQGAELSVDIAHPQAGGALHLESAPGSTASAEVRAPAGTAPAELLVLPSALRIANDPASVAEYRVTVPASVRRVRVRIGNSPPIIVESTELGRRIEL